MDWEAEKANRLAAFTLERASDAIFWHGADGRFTHANPAACELLGYTHEELRTLAVTDIVADSTRESFLQAWKKIRQEGILTFEDELVTRQGQRLPVEVRINYVEFEDNEYVCSFIRDITERKKVEQERQCAFDEIKRLRAQLERENEYLQEEVEGLKSFGGIVGSSPALQAILHQIEMVAETDACVFIHGESGTGKELIAHEIHKRSQRSHRPMIRVNCASIPRDLYESEFFGHVRGAFTGAVKDRVGRFDLADGGTLFLDEIGEIPLDLQSKLLRVLQEGTFERLGDETTRRVDVRIIAATNRDVKREMERGRFREDLYYRLNVFPIDAPPLRKRKDDILLLAQYFIDQSAKKLGKPVQRLTRADGAQLKNYDWPGNVRELQNVIERGVITSRGNKLRFNFPGSRPGDSTPEEERASPVVPPAVLTDEAMKQREKDNLLAALKQTDGKVFGPGGAAELLAMSPTTLASRIKRLGLKKTFVQ